MFDIGDDFLYYDLACISHLMGSCIILDVMGVDKGGRVYGIDGLFGSDIGVYFVEGGDGLYELRVECIYSTIEEKDRIRSKVRFLEYMDDVYGLGGDEKDYIGLLYRFVYYLRFRDKRSV